MMVGDTRTVKLLELKNCALIETFCSYCMLESFNTSLTNQILFEVCSVYEP